LKEDWVTANQKFAKTINKGITHCQPSIINYQLPFWWKGKISNVRLSELNYMEVKVPQGRELG
jgi:hypothetical protein